MNNFLKPILPKISQRWIMTGVILLLLLTFHSANAAPLLQSDLVVVRMHRLNDDGSMTPLLCQLNDENYGCTAVRNNSNYPYPYGTAYPSVPIDTDYLQDVVAQEMSPELYGEAAALEAQAITSRSFANYYMNNIPADGFNNSTQYQAFIPNRFEALNLSQPPNEVGHCGSALLNGYQQKVCAAIASRAYIASASPSGNQYAAKALFTADIEDETDDGTFDKPYLASVLDPISVACDAADEGENQYGMSQKGANRWARGHQCSRSGDENFSGDPWSVKWASSEQILFHYYTDVHLLDHNGNRLSPEYRWNPLAITGLPAVISHGEFYSLNIQLQNTGVYDYQCNAPPGGMLVPVPFITEYNLRYFWYKPGHSPSLRSGQIDLCGLQKGSSVSGTLDVGSLPFWGSGTYTLLFDIEADGADGFWFSNRTEPNEPSWPRYGITVCVDSCDIYLPNIKKPIAVITN